MFGNFVDYAWYLSGIERNATGYIVSAKAAISAWTLEVAEGTEVDQNDAGGVGLQLALVSRDTLAWEQEFIDITAAQLAEFKEELDVELFYQASRR